MHGVFRQRPSPVSTQGSISYCTENPVRCKCSYCGSTWSHLKHNQCRLTWRGLNLPCGQELGQVQSNQGCAPRRHRSHTWGLSLLDRGLTSMWELGCTFLGRRHHHWAPQFTHIRKCGAKALSLNISRGKSKTVVRFCDHVVVRVQGRAKNLME